jgi:hypothetical protein
MSGKHSSGSVTPGGIIDILVALKKEEAQLLQHLKTIRRIMKQVKKEYEESGTKEKVSATQQQCYFAGFLTFRIESLSIQQSQLQIAFGQDAVPCARQRSYSDKPWIVAVELWSCGAVEFQGLSFARN